MPLQLCDFEVNQHGFQPLERIKVGQQRLLVFYHKWKGLRDDISYSTRATPTGFIVGS